MSRFRWTSLIALMALSVVVLVACGQQASVVEVTREVPVTVQVTKTVKEMVEVTREVPVTATPLPPEKVIRIIPGTGTYPDIIDPQKSSFNGEIAHLRQLYEGLTRLDQNLNTVPGAAEKWQYNSDATQLTFTLRPGLKYSDGSLLNAKRFEYAIKRNINPATAGEYAQITDEIKGAAAWRASSPDDPASATLEQAVAVHASHADGSACSGYEDAACNTLTMAFERPAPYFHTVMSLWVTYPAKEENITEGGENWWNSSKYQVGNGPYILQSLEPFVRAVFVPNPNYWRGVARVNLEFSYITDTSVALEAYKNNELDIIASGSEDFPVIEADATLKTEHRLYPGSCSFAVMFHQLKEPFTDQKVREAFAMALDREAWVRDVLQGLGTPTLTWIPPGYPGYDAQENRWGYDPEAARKALAESSYGSAANLPPLKATFADTPRNRARFEWLVAKWQDVLGVDITLDPVESTTFTALTKDVSTAPQMFILGWCADYPDPQNWLSVYWKTGGFGERLGYSNPEFDALVNKADVETNVEKRMDLYAQAQRLLTDGAPVAFMWDRTEHFLVKPWVEGLQITPQDADWPGSGDPLAIDVNSALLKR